VNITKPERKSFLAITQMVEEKSKDWSFVPYIPVKNTQTTVEDAELHRPGLALTGFVERFSWERVQIIGETEWTYLNSLSKKDRIKSLELYFKYALPCIIVTKSQKPQNELINFCKRKMVPLFGTSHSTVDIMNDIHNYLEEYFAPFVTLHGTLVDVYGVGILYIGRSGIGKSECALDLVERGHRLVADDIVKISRVRSTLIGATNELIRPHLEIRGVGVIDLQNLFGIRAIRSEKKIEVVVELTEQTPEKEYERIGIDEKTIDILGVHAQKIEIPVSPGKNIAIISEIIAMNVLLKMNGIYSAREFNRKLIEAMKTQKKHKKTV
jgi:HPr kinase/phosphorylase